MHRDEECDEEFSAERHRLRSLKRNINDFLDDVYDTLKIIEHQNKQILSALKVSRRREIAMARNLDEVYAEVERNTSLDTSIMAMLDGVREQLKASGMNAMDQQRVDKIFDDLKANNDRIAAAIAANTPAAEGGGAPGEGGGAPAEGGNTGEPVAAGSLGGAKPNE